jgi:hypothetical protein
VWPSRRSERERPARCDSGRVEVEFENGLALVHFTR